MSFPKQNGSRVEMSSLLMMGTREKLSACAQVLQSTGVVPASESVNPSEVLTCFLDPEAFL